jgi:hypothetical protein
MMALRIGPLGWRDLAVVHCGIRHRPQASRSLE